LVMKYHHCMLDGVAGAGLATVLLDLEQHPAEPPIPAEGNTENAGREPSDLELLTRGLFHAGTTPVRALRYGTQLARRAVSVAAAARDGVLPPVRSPRTSLNRSIGAQRAFAFTSVSLDDVKRIRRHFDAAFDDADGTGVKVNDVFLALCAGALRRHLEDLGELPDAPLSCGVPVSTREPGDSSLDNRVGFMIVSLATDVADPAERLRAIATSSRRAKDFTRTVRSTPLASVGETAPPLLVGPAIRLAYEARLLGRPFDLWSVGARVTGIFSTSVILEGMGLNVTLFTYGDRVDFGLHVDPEQVPDPWAIAERIPGALAELLTAGGLGAPTPVEDAFGITAPVSG
ncbi:MAG: WS/DGAT domain-containing protein, partial [Acidimicrobiales bacterium]|nr:WS/DGAT domain-containing protein [Acidimicrobiales bacterium]